jgi:hypothetical protein
MRRVWRPPSASISQISLLSAAMSAGCSSHGFAITLNAPVARIAEASKPAEKAAGQPIDRSPPASSEARNGAIATSDTATTRNTRLGA